MAFEGVSDFDAAFAAYNAPGLCGDGGGEEDDSVLRQCVPGAICSGRIVVDRVLGDEYGHRQDEGRFPSQRIQGQGSAEDDRGPNTGVIRITDGGGIHGVIVPLHPVPILLIASPRRRQTRRRLGRPHGRSRRLPTSRTRELPLGTPLLCICHRPRLPRRRIRYSMEVQASHPHHLVHSLLMVYYAGGGGTSVVVPGWPGFYAKLSDRPSLNSARCTTSTCRSSPHFAPTASTSWRG